MNGPPDSAARNRDVYKRQEKKTTILFSSHILSETEHIADTVGVLSGGKIVDEADLKELKERKQGSLEDYFFTLMTGGDSAC